MKKFRNIIILVAVLLVAGAHSADAQKVSLSSNLITWANLGTANLEGSISVHKNVTVFAGANYNPWEMRTISEVPLSNKQITGFVGAKYWPWHVYSGWWFGAKAQFKDFDTAGLISQNLISGQALGAGLSAGYSIMIGSHVNLDLGIGAWGGRVLKYTSYKDIGGYEVDKVGARNFIFIDSVIVAFAYIF